MTPRDFYLFYFLPNLLEFLIILFLVFCLYFFIFKRQVYSLFDPLVLSLIFSAFGAADVIFMYRKNLISEYYFSSYVLTQVSFSIGWIIIKPIKLQKLKRKQNIVNYYSSNKQGNLLYTKLFFLSSLLIFIISYLATYVLLGIPLFMPSRLDLFADSGTLSILQRFNQVTPTIVIFLGFHLNLFSKKKAFKLLVYLSMILVMIFSFLSGSKSTFLVIIYSLFYYWLWSFKLGYNFTNLKVLTKIKKYREKIKIYQLILFIAVFCSALAVIAITREEDNSFLALFISFVNRGDVYIYSYPNGVLEKLQQANPFLAIFKGPIGALNIVDSGDLPTSLGLQIFRYHFDTNTLIGPNPRHNVFGLFYFGYYFSVIYSFVLGIILGFVRNRLFYLFRPTIISGLIYTLLVMLVDDIETDINLFIGQLFNVILVTLFIAIITYLLDSKSMMKSHN